MLKIENLQKVVDQNPIVDIDALQVGEGEIVAVVGPAGSGKEPLFSMLTGQSRPTVGHIHLAGIEPYLNNDGFSRLAGVVFLEDGHYLRQTPRANLQFQCRLRGLPNQRVDEILAEVGLADQSAASLNKLPTGLSRRLAFGRALLHHPRVLIAMEPFARCDEASINLLSGLFRRLVEYGGAVLLLADDSANLSGICDVIYPMNQGRLAEGYRPSESSEGAIPFLIPVKLEGRVALVNPGEILFADAGEGRAFLQTLEGRLPTQFTLTELESRLARSGFFRAHRGYLVNLQHVKEVIPFTRNSFSLRLDDPDGTLIPLSKTAAGELRDLLGY
jgi:ABC-2 type transport system ATP-binding protein